MATIRTKLKNVTFALGGAAAGITGHHFGGKLLSYQEDKIKEAIQEERDKTLKYMKEQLDSLVTNVNTMHTKIDAHNEEILNQEDKVLTQYKNEIQEAIETVNNGRRSIEVANETFTKSLNNGLNETGVNKGLEELTMGKQTLNTASEKLEALLNKIHNRNNFWGESELKTFYEFLDSLSLIQELAFLNTMYILCITIVIWNIYSIVFANEIIKYFNIEEK
uniref:Uncharacterized protein n=1 Tax=Clavulina sp. TaxID=1745192 RepID=A0A890JL78_9AGAM|nr:hypothetical protein [Clavulina sp.]